MKAKINNDKNRLAKSGSDVLAWLAVAFLLIGGIVANYHYREIVWALRAAAGLLIICLALVIAAQTAKGRAAWNFTVAARSELRKVVWPTRQEAVQVTGLIVAVVMLMVFILWGIDSVLMWAVSWLTGSAG